MLALLSPAKSLDTKTPAHVAAYSQPAFLKRSETLIRELKKLSPAEIADLMGLSDALALLNFDRFANWKLPFTPENAKQAVLMFNGDVYEGLDAATLNSDDLDFAQQHLRILSGLYGILKPLDLMQPYRLEMGTKFKNPIGKDLYAFWGEDLLKALCDELDKMPMPLVLNLASEEYFKAVMAKKLPCKVIQPVFEDWKGGKYKIISFYAKRARGLMARYMVQNRIDHPEKLQGFDVEGYVFTPEVSDTVRWVFRRRSI